MTPERWQRLRHLYDIALDHSPEQRDLALHRESGGDSTLVADVLRLLREEEEAASFLESSPVTGLLDNFLNSGLRTQIGDLVAGRYRIVRLIGSGGMGDVYEAVEGDEEDSERVAIKTVRADRSGDPNAQKRLRREALLARRITHPNVCHVFDIIRHKSGEEEMLVLVMELLSGCTLAQANKQDGKWNIERAEPIIRQMAAALNAAHACGVVHRDFKPSNVMLTPDRVVVMDFGLAVPDVNFPDGPLTATTLTLSGQIIGTPEYMAPEQIRSRTATPRSDVYSFGVVVYEMLTGQRPTHGASGIEEILNRVLVPPKSPRELNPDIPASWEALILGCLEINPDARWPSAGRAIAELEKTWRLPRWKTPSRRTFVFLGAGVALLAAGSRVLIDSTLPGSKLLMTPIANKTGDHDFDQLAPLLERQIAQSSKVSFVDTKAVAAAQARMNLPPDAQLTAAQFREIALRDGAAGVISGTISNIGSDFELRLRLEALGQSPLRSRRTQARDFTAASKREVLTGIEEASRWVRQQAGEALADIGKLDLPAEDVTTNSWQAWRLYAEAKSRTEKNQLSDAITLLKEAIRFDPAFVMAWRDRADIEIRRQDFLNGYASWTQAIAVLDQRHNSSIEAYRTRGMFYEDTGDLPQAEQAYRALLALVPGDYPARLYLSSLLRKMQRKDEALAMVERLIADFPDKPHIYTHTIIIYLSQNRIVEARRNAALLREKGLLAWADYASYTIAMTEQDFHAARTAATNLSKSADPAWAVRGPLVLASFNGYRGDLEGCRQSLRLALDHSYQESGSSWGLRLHIWDLYLRLRQDPQLKTKLRDEFQALPASGVVPEVAVDHAFMAHHLDLPVKVSIAAQWPQLPVFAIPRAQIALLAHPTEPQMAAILVLCKSLPDHRQQDVLEFAAEVSSLHKWPTAAITNALQQGKPSHWWGNEMNVPARTQID